MKEILQEKNEYERQAKIRDMATLLKEQKLQLMEYESKFMSMKSELDAANSKIHLNGTFIKD